MPAKRVTDVSSEYESAPSKPARDVDIRRIKSLAVPLKTGRLERDVDALLASKGLALGESLSDTVKEFQQARRSLGVAARTRSLL